MIGEQCSTREGHPPITPHFLLLFLLHHLLVLLLVLFLLLLLLTFDRVDT